MRASWMIIKNHKIMLEKQKKRKDKKPKKIIQTDSEECYAEDGSSSSKDSKKGSKLKKTTQIKKIK